MATHARQQYFADESSLSKEKREFSIAEEVQQKIDSIEEGAQVNTIETIKVNGVEVQPDENKAIDLAVPGVVDSLDSTSSTDALSARQGKVLYDYIQDVSHIGHFLALWNASTGLPVTNPDTSPYVYNTGDFYTISVVAPIGGTNYRPDGTQFVIGQASTTVETENISVNDFYFYDGQVWRHMINSGAGSIAIDDSLSTTSTNPVTNRRVTQAINSKQDVLTAGVGINIDSNNEITNTQPGPIISATQPSTANEGDQWYDTTNSVLKVYDGTQWNEVGSEGNTKTFYLSSTSDLVNAQAAYDWYLAGKNPILSVTFNNNKKNKVYVIDYGYRDSQLYFRSPQPRIINQNIHGVSDIDTEGLTFDISNGTVSAIYSFAPDAVRGFLNTNYNYPTPYTPQYPGSPATKKYVDDNVIQVGATAPSNPIEGMVWYDTTNDVLKSYDGTNWNEIGKEYNAGNGIRVGNYSPTQGPCAEGFHIPTETEWQSLLDTGASLAAWQEDSGDYSQSGVSEYLKLPYPPQLYDGVPYEDDTGGYWTSTAGTDGYSSCLSVTSGSAYITLYERYIGLNIRGFKDVPVAPDNTWTTLYDGSSTATGAGIFYKASLGLISISEDGTTWITIADKNVGATTVYEYGDTFSASNCGQYFQRGNNYGFPFAGATNTTKERVDTSNCTPGSYNSSTYIIASPDWSQPSNDNLWVETGTIISNTIMNIGVTSINGKTGDVNLESANTKTFYLSSTSDLTNAQAVIDYILSGKNAIVSYQGVNYIYAAYSSNNYNKFFDFDNSELATNTSGSTVTKTHKRLIIRADVSTNVVNNISTSDVVVSDVYSVGTGLTKTGTTLSADTTVLATKADLSNYLAQDNTTSFTPTGDYNPATKKYVDDNVIQKSATAPSSPTEGMVRYDTTNDQLKVYDGTNWNVTGKEYTQGNGINITNDTISVDTSVVATQTDLSTKQDTLVSGTNIKTINGVSILGSGNITTPAVVLSLPAVGDDERELYAALYTGKTVTLKSGSSYYQVWKFIDNTSTTGKFTVCASNGNDNVTDDATIGYMITGERSNGITAVTQYSKDYFTALNNGVRVFSYESPLGTYWNVGSALDWQNQGGQVIFKRNNYLSPDHKDTIYYVSYWDMNNNTIYLLSETGTGLVENVVTYNASGQITNVTTTSLGGGLQVSPNSTITGIKYIWYGTEADYAGLSQYYTDTPGDTEFHTF